MPKTRKYNNRKRARKGLKRASKPLYKAVKAIAEKEAYKAQETKYVLNQFSLTGTSNRIYNSLSSKLVAGNFAFLQNAMPSINGGVGPSSSQFIGQKVRLVRGYTKFLLYLQPGWNVNTDLIVKVFLLNSKSAKNINLATLLPASDLLRTGNANQCDFTPVALSTDARLLHQLPLNNMAWSGSVREFRFTKNVGQMNFDSRNTPPVPGDVPNLASHTNYHEFTWDWTRKMDLKYDTISLNPTNYCPMFGMVAFTPDGTPIDTTQPDAPTVISPVAAVITNHMWYKDA